MKKLSILIVFACILIISQAKNNKFNISLGGGQTINDRTIRFPFNEETNQEFVWVKKEKVPYFQIYLGYYFNNAVETGIYAGYSDLMLPSKPNDIYDNSFGSGSGFFYGCQIKYHIFNALSKRQTRIDFYGLTQAGVLTKHWNDYYSIIHNESILEFGAGLGTTFYFTRKFGVFGEALWGKFYYSNFNWRTGFNFRF